MLYLQYNVGGVIYKFFRESCYFDLPGSELMAEAELVSLLVSGIKIRIC